ncbi:MAG: altronate dehydratase, partial [Methylobacteriaceae bacterium]|nr:altronate dehydratase [Methylobacteriaceae bacterium]
MTTPRTLRLNARDNIVVAVDAIAAGATAAGIPARARVPKGHKMAIVPIAVGEPVRKFGQIIGFASQPIAPGD